MTPSAGPIVGSRELSRDGCRRRRSALAKVAENTARLADSLPVQRLNAR